ncbi:hypothetical protein G5I_03828 [Acromyrmex echinatior]|uniref:Uncharacterized protein n=1 Tax=Acromyrmex echinatior TaxID=103372 RepID=F4WDZ9_ACREC|nr:hypothetical protein G5I_03828 [Acromyrmex echinatior]
MKPKKKTMKKKVTKKRILPTAKRGGAVPVLPMLGALGSLISGAASVVKAILGRLASQRRRSILNVSLCPDCPRAKRVKTSIIQPSHRQSREMRLWRKRNKNSAEDEEEEEEKEVVKEEEEEKD